MKAWGLGIAVVAGMMAAAAPDEFGQAVYVYELTR